MKRLIWIVLALGIGCLAEEPVATVIFYQSGNILAYNRIAAAPVFIDETQVAVIRDKRQCSVKVSSGRHIIRGKTRAAILKLNAEPGKTYYVRILERQSFAHVVFTPVFVHVEQGKLDTADLEPSEAKDVTPGLKGL